MFIHRFRGIQARSPRTGLDRRSESQPIEVDEENGPSARHLESPKRMLWVFLHLLAFLALTILTQIGGLAYLGALALAKLLRGPRRFRRLTAVAMFVVLYAALWTSANVVAPYFGRVPLPCTASKNSKLAVQSSLYCVLNRHYVTPKLMQVANDLADHMAARFPSTRLNVLDASFPFFDGFPLLPHLSHSDGRKLDLAYFYKDRGGQAPVADTKSPIGYWAFEQPKSARLARCVGRGDIFTLRWDMDWFQVFHRDYQLDERRTAAALRWLVTEGAKRGVSKIFVEPHLATRFNVASKIIRFQGCRAARHDDHIHFQVR